MPSAARVRAHHYQPARDMASGVATRAPSEEDEVVCLGRRLQPYGVVEDVRILLEEPGEFAQVAAPRRCDPLAAEAPEATGPCAAFLA